MNNIDWENVWIGFFLIVACLFVTMLYVIFSAEKKVNYYYLSNGQSANYNIKVDINYAEDFSIELPDTMNLFTATRLVDSLNKTIK